MTRIIVHAGFHKTGTTSLQDFMNRNREVLRPHLSFYGKDEFLQAGSYARLFGQRPYIWRRLRFRKAFRHFLATVPDAKMVVLSRETFSGVMLGHRDIYKRPIRDQTNVAIALAREIIAALRARFGEDSDIVFLYTTRDTDSWLRSIYGHLLRSIHLTTNYSDFRQQLGDVPSPADISRDVAKAIAPVPVHTASLSDYADHLYGPAGSILDLAGVPRDSRAQLVITGRRNQGQSPEIEARFLELNRSKRSKSELKAIKDQILQAAEKGPGK